MPHSYTLIYLFLSTFRLLRSLLIKRFDRNKLSARIDFLWEFFDMKNRELFLIHTRRKNIALTRYAIRKIHFHAPFLYCCWFGNEHSNYFCIYRLIHITHVFEYATCRIFQGGSERGMKILRWKIFGKLEKDGE